MLTGFQRLAGIASLVICVTSSHAAIIVTGHTPTAGLPEGFEEYSITTSGTTGTSSGAAYGSMLADAASGSAIAQWQTTATSLSAHTYAEGITSNVDASVGGQAEVLIQFEVDVASTFTLSKYGYADQYFPEGEAWAFSRNTVSLSDNSGEIFGFDLAAFGDSPGGYNTSELPSWSGTLSPNVQYELYVVTGAWATTYWGADVYSENFTDATIYIEESAPLQSLNAIVVVPEPAELAIGISLLLVNLRPRSRNSTT